MVVNAFWKNMYTYREESRIPHHASIYKLVPIIDCIPADLFIKLL